MCVVSSSNNINKNKIIYLLQLLYLFILIIILIRRANEPAWAKHILATPIHLKLHTFANYLLAWE